MDLVSYRYIVILFIVCLMLCIAFDRVFSIHFAFLFPFPLPSSYSFPSSIFLSVSTSVRPIFDVPYLCNGAR